MSTVNNQITIAENLSVIPVIATNAPRSINAVVGFPRNWGIITLPYYYTDVNYQAQDERAKLFGSWEEIGDEDDTLKEIYESRLIPSTFKNE